MGQGMALFAIGEEGRYQERCVSRAGKLKRSTSGNMERNGKIETEVAKQHVAAWLEAELELYSGPKYPEEETRRAVEGNVEDWGTVEDRVGMYMRRATILGFDNPRGRQALAKGLRTLLTLTERVVEMHGPLPKPGVPSGEISDWEWEA